MLASRRRRSARSGSADRLAKWRCASTPFVSRSSTMRCCSAAVPSAVILNSASTSGSSSSAFSTPRRAIVQKSAELLVTNASLSVLVPPVAFRVTGSQPTQQRPGRHTACDQLSACVSSSASAPHNVIDRDAERHDPRRRSRKDVRSVSCLLLVRISHARDRRRGPAPPHHRDRPPLPPPVILRAI